MQGNKIRLMTEEFEVEETGERMPGVTILIEGQFKRILDVLIEKNGYQNYMELIQAALIEGIGDMMGISPEDRK